MDSLPPVRTPASLYWREFRIQVLPYIVFAVVVVAVVLLWRDYGGQSQLQGVAEGVRSIVSSPRAGMVQLLPVEPYQLVSEGDPVAVILPQDPRAQLDLLQTEVDLARMSLQPSIAEGNAMNFEQIRMEFFRTQSELAIAQVNLERAENSVRRNEPLFTEKLVSEDLYDLGLKTRDMYRVEVQAKSNAVASIQQRLEWLEKLGDPNSTTNAPVQELLSVLRTMQLAAGTNYTPVTLNAPIEGMVNSIFRHPGEHVVEGEPLVTINSRWANRIVGYLRQPYPSDPEIGLEVVVTTRERKRQQFRSSIVRVGAQVEVITNSLAFVKQGALVDAGLPFVVELPPEINIRPGEVVDLLIQGKRAPVTQAERAERK